MLQQVGRRVFSRASTRAFALSTNYQKSCFFALNNMHEPRLDCAKSLSRYAETTRACDWYNNLNCGGKTLLEKMIIAFKLQGIKAKSLIKLIAQKFNISLRLARNIVDWRISGKPSPLPYPENKVHTPENPAASLAQWEKMASCSGHNYENEISMHLLHEETKQETTWHAVRDDVVELDKFAPIRRHCAEVMINFSYKYKLQLKTTEAAFVYLNRFLLLPEARIILDSESGVKGTTGKYSLRAVCMCLLMISAKYEEVYRPELSLFAKYTQYSTEEFVELEAILLDAMNCNLMTSTSTDFIVQFFEDINCTSTTKYLALFILEASWLADLSCGDDMSIFNPSSMRWLQNGRKNTMPGCVLHVAKPSEIALGCIILSLAYQGKNCYPDTLEHSAGVSVDSLGPIVKHLHMQLRAVTERHETHCCAAVEKYSSRRYHCIGAFKPQCFHELLEHKAFRGTTLFEKYTFASPIQLKF